MLSRDVKKAKEAYREKNISLTKQAHDVHVSFSTEKHTQSQGHYIKSIIYGGLDGIITTFAVVSGVAGASLSPAIILILGFANLIGDGISMAMGDYLGSKSEQEYAKAERKREEWEVEHYPEGERREVFEIFESKGIPKEKAQTLTDIITSHKETWISIMMVEELGIIENNESPLKNAMATFFSFIIFGFIPMLSFVLAKFLPGLQQKN